MGGIGRQERQATVVSSKSDLNGDQISDFVLRFEDPFSCAYGAFSGADGSSLWIKTTIQQIGVSKMVGPNNFVRQNDGKVSLREELVDIDGDQTPDFIWVENETVRASEVTQMNSFMRAEATSGRTGETIWRTTIPDQSFNRQKVPSWTAFLPVAPTLMRFQGKTNVVIAHLAEIHLVNLFNGSIIETIDELPDFVRSLKSLDVDGDGNQELIFSHPIDRDIQKLTAYSFKSKSELWHTRIRTKSSLIHDGVSSDHGSAFVDVDNDQLPESLIGERMHRTQRRLRLIDCATGTDRWTADTDEDPRWSSGCLQIPFVAVPSPDLNGDGTIDYLNLSWIVMQSGPYDDSRLEIQAISGDDGSLLWEASHFIERDTSFSRWSVTSVNTMVQSDGQPILIVSTETDKDGKVLTFDAHTGQFQYSLDDAARATFHDFDADALHDLCFESTNESSDLYKLDQRSFRVIRAKTPVRWRLLSARSDLKPVGDVDGDGYFDLSDRPTHDGSGRLVVAS
ncbi:MAG: hypothetical protein CMJ78_21595 [Planctomycetaceae bacterium]|nr:hypothetical protein [Planctomycetaceae bacterium]